ncbi:hypothetical protein K438DRAFT_1799877 [Mycena galopus ATCC 62051]|nr:hypothetical protein K438DRAFT_1799877 [Mycena galopus ATCC 62051]
MDDPPYTAAEDDPFHIQPLLLQPRRRRSSMLNKWIKDQQQVPTQQIPTDIADDEGPLLLLSGTRSNPYLAYPELGSPAFHESAVSVNSYDMVEDDDLPEHEMPVTPLTTPSRRGSGLLTPSSFRGFHIPFRSSSPAGSVGTSPGTTSRPPTLGRFFPRASRSSIGSAHVQHTRSSSLSTLNALAENSSFPANSSLPASPATKSKWRPSVLNHFTSASQPSVVPSDTLHTRSRPSISSYTTTLTATDSDMPITPPRSLAPESVRARNRSHGSLLKLPDNASSFSVWSGPSYLDELSEFSRGPPAAHGATSTVSCDGYIDMRPRVPLGPKPGSRLSISNMNPQPMGNRPAKQDNKPEIAYSSPESKSRTLPRVSFALARKRKKRLIISGIASGDTRKFEAAKRWCEGFGEVSQITRMPNDDLHVHFRNADVADTVCRLRAKVYIRGVGSVQLSWYVATGTENRQ